MKRVRFCAPFPHDFSQADHGSQDDTVHAMGHGVVLQARVFRILDS